MYNIHIITYGPTGEIASEQLFRSGISQYGDAISLASTFQERDDARHYVVVDAAKSGGLLCSPTVHGAPASAPRKATRLTA